MAVFVQDTIDGVKVKTLLQKDFEIELNFDKDSESFEGEVRLDRVDFIREDAKYLTKKFNEGITTGSGILEGISYDKEIIRNGITEPIFKGYIDLRDAEFFCDKVNAPVKERAKTDWLNEVATSFSPEYLHSIGEILTSDFEWMPYVLNPVQNNIETFITIFTTIYTGNEVYAAIDKIIDLTFRAANPFEATAIAITVAYIIYLTGLLIILIQLLIDLVTLIIQPVKYHACMNVYKQISACCKHLGFSFHSPDFLDLAPWKDELFIMPEKQFIHTNNDDKRILGFTKPNQIEQRGYFKGSFGELLQAIAKQTFRLKIIITDNKELFLVKQNYNPTVSLYQMPDILNRSFKTNADKIKSNVYFTFQTDISDSNTIQEYSGTSVQLINKPLKLINSDLLLLTGIDRLDSPFALAKMKTELTVPEEILDVFLEVFGEIINGLISAINLLIDAINLVLDLLNDIIDALAFVLIDIGFELPTVENIEPVTIGDLIDNRIGMLKIENDSFSIPKLFMMQKGSGAKFNKISPNNFTLLTADYIRTNFHETTSFVPSPENPTANQYLIKIFDNFRFCFEDYLKVKNNKYIRDAAGNIIELVNLKWKPVRQIATATVKIPKLYTKNIYETKLLPNGQ